MHNLQFWGWVLIGAGAMLLLAEPVLKLMIRRLG